MRAPDHSQIPYFVEKQKYPTHTVGRVWVGWVVQSHSPGKVLVVLSQGNSLVRRDKYLPPPLSVNRVGGLGFVWGAPSVVDMWGTGVTQSAPSGHFGSSGRPRSLTASPLDNIQPTHHSLCLVPEGRADDVRLHLPDLREGI